MKEKGVREAMIAMPVPPPKSLTMSTSETEIHCIFNLEIELLLYNVARQIQ